MNQAGRHRGFPQQTVVVEETKYGFGGMLATPSGILKDSRRFDEKSLDCTEVPKLVGGLEHFLFSHILGF